MESKQKFKPNPDLKLMDYVRQVFRYHLYAYRTEKTYCDWIVRYIKFHGANIHPKYMGKSEIEAFLSDLATDKNVSASTQKQALNAIIFYTIMYWICPRKRPHNHHPRRYYPPGIFARTNRKSELKLIS